ncbi:hypothetical protein D3C81_2054350 [compost metagenome]
MVCGVFTPGIGQAGIGFPMLGKLITHAHLTAHNCRVDVIGLADTGVVGIVLEQDKVIHMTQVR